MFGMPPAMEVNSFHEYQGHLRKNIKSRPLKIQAFYKIQKKKICVEFQRVPMKLYANDLTHVSKNDILCKVNIKFSEVFDF